ncbi:MAG TPA: hypothetical protein VHM28_09800 [Anaerolineales bacterium]|nr:hypothetical protein [Anaerolineales bacterium]
MKHPARHSNFFIAIIVLITLVACGPNSTSGGGNVPASSQSPAGAETPTLVAVNVSDVHHQVTPGDLPAKPVEHSGDSDSSTTASQNRAPSGDRFTFGQFERPFNANTMDQYFPYLDIQDAQIFLDDTFVYAAVILKGRDANNTFPGKYAAELDLNRDGHGDLLVVVDHPASADWTTNGVQIFADKDGDVGGSKVIFADSSISTGDGYEALVFDQGHGDDPDAAWVRLSPDDPNTILIAIKQSVLGSSAYLVGLWAGNHLDPALFDFNDHLTHEQAGAALQELENFYPIKGLSELDNTCRIPVGFVATGAEPGVCPVEGGPRPVCTLTNSYCNQKNVCSWGGHLDSKSCQCDCNAG